MNWPTLPESFEGMDSVALRTLADAINAARRANLPNLTADDEAEYDQWTQRERNIRALAVDAAESERLAAEQAAAEQAEAERLAAEEAAGDPEPEPGDDGDGGGDDDGDGGGDGGGGEAGAGGGQQLATVGAPAVPTGMGTGAAPVRVADRRAARWVSTGRASNGPARNERFETNLALAQAIQDMASVVADGDSTKHYLGALPGNYAATTTLPTEKPWLALQDMLDGSTDEIEAAFCPPATPIYDMHCENVTRRPVFMGLPAFRLPAERGAFTVLASPTLSSITQGTGQWTSSMDNDPEAIKAACQTVSCVDPSTYEIYGIYRCLTVKNLMQMTFPELVAAYLNRLQAVSSREAEILLLEAMNTSATSISAPALGYGGTTSILSTILNYLALYQELERWDTVTMDAWAPRWVLWAIKTDLMRRRRTDGGRNLIASDAEVNAMFRDAGVEIHWFMDMPSWTVALNPLALGNVLQLLPSSVDILIHRRGKFAIMDRGQLSIGVTGNNIYRLEDDLRRNQFTFFFENFEGLIDTDSCDAHKIRIPACWNGVQIADDVIDCEGNNYAGVGSGD
jgi:hypothetical protein